MKQKAKRNLRQQRDEESDEEETVISERIKVEPRKSCLSFADELCLDRNSNKKSSSKLKKSKSITPVIKEKVQTENKQDFTIKVKPLAIPPKPKPKEIAPSYFHEENIDEVYIPDAQAIHEARLRRQRMRDFFDRDEISLKDEPLKTSIYDKDDITCDSDSEQKVIQFKTSVHIAAEERQLVRDRFLTCEQGSDCESEDSYINEQDNFSTWELEQIRKGVGIRPQAVAGNCDQMTEQMVAAAQSIVASKYVPFEPNQQLSDDQMPKFRTRLTLVQIQENVVNRIQGKQIALQQFCAERETLEDASGTDTVKHIECKENIEKDYEFLSCLKEYAFDIRECMLEKLPQVEDLERKSLELFKKRIRLIIERRRFDVRDQDFEFSLAKFVDVNDVNSDPRTPLDPDRQQRSLQRQMRQQKLKIPEDDCMEYTSDDGGFEEESILKNEIGAVLNQFASIWYDVNPNFYEMSTVIEILSSWKDKYPQSYSNIKKFIPSTIFYPVVRCAGFYWNPAVTILEYEKWIQQLHEFAKKSEDVNLIVDIVLKIVLPVLVSYSRVYDIARVSFSSNLTKTVIYLFQICNESVIRESQLFSEFSENIQTSINETLEAEVFLPLYPQVVVQNTNCGASQFFRKQLFFQIRLFRNVLTWDGILPHQFMIDCAIEKILNRCILLSLKCQTYDLRFTNISIKIAEFIPISLLIQQDKSEKTICQLEAFCLYLRQLAENLPSDENKGIIFKQIKNSLIRLNSLDHAVSIGF